MALFRFQWLRRLVRRHSSPIPVDTAGQWKLRLSVVYMLVAWNAFGFVGYMMYTGKTDWAKYYGLISEEELNMKPGQQWAKTLGIKDATVYSVSGFNVSSYEVHDEGDDKEQISNINT
ncbi:hypothetical protein NQ314_012724 [Rhamnusium bicolor]|uniref:Uncharacterized protein n=1 Tax=Rhamnusium bicolor TaxID=1586634 RepID=A0AAV8XAC2_9CUCU|nr:hypothetical protein NQ314_012724 [Rhamnusium bicolor]